MLYGYGGTILRLNLTTGQITKTPTPEDLAKKFLGGRGFVAKILYDEIPLGIDAFSPENKVVIASGPLSGVFLPSAGKIEFGTKSPATGGYSDSNMGGHMAPELKYAGYDAVIIEGRAARPSLIVIDDDRVEIRDATRYWGQGSFATEKALKKELGEDFQIATIGPAGEKLVRFACLSHDFGRQAGRTGVGAVLGSKQVKAIAIRGTKSIPLADPAGAFKKGKEMYQAVFSKPGFKEWTPYGTAGVTDWVNEVGSFPTRNFQTGFFEKYKEINGQTLREKIWINDKGCFSCPIPCGKYSKATVGGKEFYVEGPEYEAIALLGGNLLLKSIEEIAYANAVCDELGLDTISGGAVVAFALEAYEKGLITKEEMGREVAFGDLDSVVYLLEKIARREGIGDLLAEGVKRAAEKLGSGAEKFAIHVKGLELSGYEPRNAPAMLLSYLTADVGAHHNRSWAITYDIASDRERLDNKAERVIELQHIRPLFDTLGICRLPWVEIGFELEHYAEIFPLITGWSYTWEDLLKVSERIWNLTRAFNAKHIPGFGRAYDQPPARLVEEPVPTGPVAGKHLTREQVEFLLDDYYRRRGWDKNGIPTREKLQELGLDFVQL